MTKWVQGNIPTRATIVNWDSSGTFTCLDDFTLTDPNGTTVQNQFEVADGAGPMIILGDVEIQTIAQFNCLGAATILCYGNIDFQGVAVSDWGTSTITLYGSLNQNVKFNSAPYNLTLLKSGGTIDFQDAWVATGDFVIRTLAAFNIKFLVGGNYGANLIDADRAAAIPNTTRCNVESSDGVGQFNFVIATAGPTARNLIITDWNLTGAIQNAGTATCVDAGNNTIAGLEGWNFLSDPRTPRAYGYGRLTHGIGLGVGLGAGGAYQYGGS